MTEQQAETMNTAYETYRKYMQQANSTPCPTCHTTFTSKTLPSEPGTHYCYRCSDWFSLAATTPAPTNQMVASVEATYSKCLGIMRRKCNDYASAENPYRNFEGCARFGLPVQQGLMVRISDKYSRLENIMSGKTLQVTDETADDTIEDLINYLAILKARRQFEADKR